MNTVGIRAKLEPVCFDGFALDLARRQLDDRSQDRLIFRAVHRVGYAFCRLLKPRRRRCPMSRTSCSWKSGESNCAWKRTRSDATPPRSSGAIRRPSRAATPASSSMALASGSKTLEARTERRSESVALLASVPCGTSIPSSSALRAFSFGQRPVAAPRKPSVRRLVESPHFGWR